MLQRSGGTSVIASTPAVSIRQKATGPSTPPGYRQPIPVIAIGSRVRVRFVCSGVPPLPNRRMNSTPLIGKTGGSLLSFVPGREPFRASPVRSLPGYGSVGRRIRGRTKLPALNFLNHRREGALHLHVRLVVKNGEPFRDH